jgi:hypothetical protein
MAVETQMRTTASPAVRQTVGRRRVGISLAEASVVLVALYALLGAGVGAACGSVLLGTLSGLVIGVMAVAAIFLISGSARAADQRVELRRQYAHAG